MSDAKPDLLDPTEFLRGIDPESLTDEQKQKMWETFMLERCQDRCSNCGSDHKVRVKPIVPFEVGGKLSTENASVLCRACEMASDVAGLGSTGSAERPVNFWVSQRLYKRIKELNGFSSTGSLVRYLMSKYVAQAETPHFDDLDLWQEKGSDVKINVWVDKQIYMTFKEVVNARGITVTDALKALIRMYEEEAEPLVRTKTED